MKCIQFDMRIISIWLGKSRLKRVQRKPQKGEYKIMRWLPDGMYVQLGGLGRKKRRITVEYTVQVKGENHGNDRSRIGSRKSNARRPLRPGRPGTHT